LKSLSTRNLGILRMVQTGCALTSGPGKGVLA